MVKIERGEWQSMAIRWMEGRRKRGREERGRGEIQREEEKSREGPWRIKYGGGERRSWLRREETGGALSWWRKEDWSTL